MIYAGIDAGSRAIKAVLIDADRDEPVASGVCDQGLEQDALACGLLDRMLEDNDLRRGDIGGIVATGYARNNVSIANTTITEITCHAHGVHRLLPAARTVIEIGGQDSKVLRLNENGAVRDFAMNDRCAAGTGRFLELVAERLGVGLDEMGRLAGASDEPAAISSMCVVFAETEIIGLLAGGAKPENIVAGVQDALTSRIHAMVGRNITPLVVFTGGVAMMAHMASALQSALRHDVTVAPNPQMTGALGAAILAAREAGDSWRGL